MTKQAKAEKRNTRVILNRIQDLQRLPLWLRTNMRGRRQIKFGMTSLFNHAGFTLIELLVVVLIIGILAAIALPQYQKAVAKARATEAVTHMKTLENAISLWVLEHGMQTNRYVHFFGDTNSETLDINFPCNPEGAAGCSANGIYYYAQCYPNTQICELSASGGNGTWYYELVTEIDNTGRSYFHKCGYSGYAGKAACDIVAAQGWETEEGWEQ